MSVFKLVIHYILKFFWIITAVLILSCEEEISIELNDQENERIVVEGRITNELKIHKVRLTKTISYFQNERVPPFLEAEVYLLGENAGNRFDMTLIDDTLGIYATEEIKGKSGETYSLMINYQGDSYKATSYLDTVASMDSINYEYEYTFYERGYYKIRMSAYEPPPLGHIYMFYIYLNDTLFNDDLIRTPYQDDLFFNDTYMANVEILYLPQEEVVSDTNHVFVEMLSISREEYYFNNAFITETYASGSIFSGPPANIPSNLVCTTGNIDGLGFFGASSVTTQEMTLIKEHDESTNDPEYKH